MRTLILSTLSLPAAPALRAAALARGWTVQDYGAGERDIPKDPVLYSGTDLAAEIVEKCDLALLEPRLNLLATLPAEFRQRHVEFATFADLRRLKSKSFVKPADAMHKLFDAGIYSRADQVATRREVDPSCPVLVAEAVEWSSEHRFFVLERKVAATSAYLSFGRPNWKPYGQGGEKAAPCAPGLAFCNRLLGRGDIALPPAFVMDVGLIDDRGWAVVEFNPVWCSGLLGADPRPVLDVLARACKNNRSLSAADRRWTVSRQA